MKTKNIHLFLQILFLSSMIAVAIICYPHLPDMVTSHWNIQGQPDNTMPKVTFLLLIPGISILLLVLMKILPQFDPKKEKYEFFHNVYATLQTTLIGFFTYIFCVSIYEILYPGIHPISFFMLLGFGVVFLLIGNYLGKIRQNYFVGIKTPWTLNNETVWNKTHRLGGILRVIAGISMIITAFLPVTSSIAFVIFIVLLIVSTLIPVLYSYIIHKRISNFL